MGGSALIARPGVGVHRRVAEVLVRRGVKVLGARLGDDAHLAAGRAAVLSLIVGGENLHLLDGVGVRDTDDLPASTGTNAGSAVKGDEGVLLARAVHVERDRAADGKVEVAKRRAASHARQQRAYVQRIAAVELLVIDGLVR